MIGDQERTKLLAASAPFPTSGQTSSQTPVGPALHGFSPMRGHRRFMCKRRAPFTCTHSLVCRLPPLLLSADTRNGSFLTLTDDGRSKNVVCLLLAVASPLPACRGRRSPAPKPKGTSRATRPCPVRPCQCTTRRPGAEINGRKVISTYRAGRRRRLAAESVTPMRTLLLHQVDWEKNPILLPDELRLFVSLDRPQRFPASSGRTRASSLFPSGSQQIHEQNR